MYELIYMVDGHVRRTYPQTETHARKLIGKIMANEPVYKIVSCEKCNNYDAYRRGYDKINEFILSETGKVNMDCVTDEEYDGVMENLLDAPFEYDKDVAYYALCENRGIKEANDFYREVTA